MTDELACPVEGCDRTGLKGTRGLEMHIKVTNDPAHDKAEEGQVWATGSEDPETPSEDTDGDGSPQEGDTLDETPEDPSEEGVDEGEETPDTEEDMPSTQELETQREQLGAPEDAQETEPIGGGEPLALPSVDTRTLVLGIGVILCIGMALYLLRSDTTPEGEEITLEEEGEGSDEDRPEGGLV